MVDDARNTLEAADNKASAEACERARTARERREVEQRRRLDELRAHAAAAQAQRERRDQERRKRQDEQRERDTDRRHQVEERKRAIWEASVSRREALLQRERDREERLERARQARSTPRSAFAFGSSTPRLLEPVDSAGFFWAARRASSTSNVMFASAPLTRRGSALHLDISDNDNKDDIDRSPQPIAWNSVARRRTDLVPTLPASRGPEGRSGDTTPGSRPGSAMSTSVQSTSVPRRPHSARRPRPASIAGTGVNTPRGGHEGGLSVVTTPSVSRDASSTNMAASVSSVTRRHPPSTPRRPRPVSVHVTPQTPVQPHKPAVTPGDGKPPILHRKPKLSKDHDKSPRMAGVKARSVSPGHTSMSPSPAASKESSVDKDVTPKKTSNVKDKSQVSATEVTQKLEALQVEDPLTDNLHEQINEKDDKTQAKATETRTEEQRPVEISKPPVEVSKPTDKPAETVQTDVLLPVEVQKEDKLEEKVEDKLEEKVEDKKEEKAVDKIEEKITEKREIRPELPEKKEPSPDKPEESDMTASMTARRITTEEQAKAALAERRRRAREELEKQAELERQRLQREAEEEAERQRLEEERQRREEEEAKELAALQRSMEQEKLRKAIEAQQQLEREEAERKAKEEAEKQLRLKEEEEKKKALEEADKLKKEEAEREEKERIARKQRVEAIMARTRMRKAEEEKKQESKQPATNGGQVTDTTPSQVGAGDNGNPPDVTNGNECAVKTEDMLGLTNSDVPAEHPTKPGATDTPTNNGNVEAVHTTHVGHLSSTFIQNERNMAEDTKEPKMDGAGDFTSHNGHGNNHSHPLTLQNAI